MIYWLIISIVGITILVFLAIFLGSDKFLWSNGATIGFGCSIGGILLFIIILGLVIFTRVDYNRFETRIEIQRTQYQELISEDFENPNNILLIEDIIDINKELSGKQASRISYNNWSLYPERVLDIKPIGLE